ncbi:TIGR01777 family oxidoreductase [Paenibacillus nasutitermitis]|uniref:Epimerase family protein YfhF n=1 Tax=Paenibacillus nasutitermitis TaxID=1652958 RepID=A0A916Z6L0_9BACL|nr:TIGR01777 family oxidoreductase [Paenibacillus nasutitermitis]GGD76663.1 epimerase family protein YfhF [Paenibacillus nasutitermitis]
MKVAVTGGTGFVGGRLADALLSRGDEVIIISRSAGNRQQEREGLVRVTWDELAASAGPLEGLHAIVNLAGESINQKWTEEAKLQILQSRLDAAEQVGKLVASLRQMPGVVVNASGISIYGTSRDAAFDEESPIHVNDFLSDVSQKWEAAADLIDIPRLVKVRVGVVLARDDGAFPKMAMPYRLFAGGKIGSGKQWLSWIHIEDMVRLLLFCIDNNELEGPVNASAPEPVTNDAFGRALGAAFHKPHWFPVPAFMMKMMFGELSTLLLEGQRALPRKALSCGFEFRYPTIKSAMEQLAKHK